MNIFNPIGLIFIGALLLLVSCNNDHPPVDEEDPGNANEITFDSILAKKLDADPYGMSQYVMVLLKSGPNRSQDSTTAAQLQSAHLENISRLADEGKLSLAGPFLDDGELRGIYIFNVSSVEEAEELTKTDPAIIAGRLEMELHPWYGSAALKEVNNLHRQIAKVKM